MHITADLHAHTIASGHAYSTLEEMALGAKRNGVKMLAITDHGPAMPDGPHLYYFHNLHVLPKYLHGTRILKGAEVNIISKTGELDIPTVFLASYEMVIASAHNQASPEKMSIKQNTNMLLKVLENPHVDILGHIENPVFPVNYKEVVGAAKEAGKIIEINNGSFTVARHGSFKNCLEIMKYIKENKQMTAINSDAHVSTQVGQVQRAMEVALEQGIKKEQILNLNHKKTAAFFKIEL